MKKNKLLLVIILCCLVVVVTACSNDKTIIMNPQPEISNNLYGSYEYFDVDGVSISFPVVNEWIVFSGGTCGLLKGVSCNHSSDNNLTIQTDGVYRITYGATGKGSNNHKFITAFFVNGEVVNSTRDIMISSAGEIHKMRGDTDIELYSGDVLDLRIRDTTSSGSGTVYEFDINIQSLGVIS